jgi:hypothetical protein
LRIELAKQAIPNTDVWEIAKRAQQIWEVEQGQRRNNRRPAPELAEPPPAKKPRHNAPPTGPPRPANAPFIAPPTRDRPPRPQDQHRPPAGPRPNPQANPPQQRHPNASSTACWNCGEEGHFHRECPKSQPPAQVAPNRLTRRQRRVAVIQELTARIEQLSKESESESEPEN